jgi:hypothetical protein
MKCFYGRLGGWFAAVATIAVMASALQADGQDEGPKLDPAPSAAEEDAGEIQVPDRWVGLGCSMVPEVLRAQLPLDEGQGLLVDIVAKESPAEAAGFKRYDVLVAADGKPLKSMDDLIGAVSSAGDKMAFEVLRGGEKLTIEVTPAPRPEQQGLDMRTRPPGPGYGDRPEWKEFEKWFEEPRDFDDGRTFRFRFFGPGAILPPRAPVEMMLPEDVSVTITRKGREPAQITVTEGDKTWEVTEEKLDELPENIRKHVKRMLGDAELERGRVRVWDFVPDLIPPRVDVRPRLDVRPRVEVRPPLRPKDDVEKQLKEELEETGRRLRDLEKRFEELRKAPPKSDDTGAEKRV